MRWCPIWLDRRYGAAGWAPLPVGWWIASFRLMAWVEAMGATPLVAGPGPSPPGKGRHLLGHPPGVGKSPPQQHFHLGIHASELIVGPADEGVVDGWIDSEQDLPAFAHE